MGRQRRKVTLGIQGKSCYGRKGKLNMRMYGRAYRKRVWVTDTQCTINAKGIMCILARRAHWYP